MIQEASLCGEAFSFLHSEGYENGSGGAAKFSQIEGIAVDLNGNVYVTDYIGEDGIYSKHTIRKIDALGNVTTCAGKERGYADGSGNNAKFNILRGVAVDNFFTLYVADTDNHKIRKIVF